MRDGEISKYISMEKCTFRELSFYSYLNDVKGKLLSNLLAKCFFYYYFFNGKSTIPCKKDFKPQMYHL